MIPGMVDPQKLAKMQELCKDVKATIRADYTKSQVLVIFESPSDEGKAVIPELVKSFPEALATQLSSFFGINGEIVEVGKLDATEE